MMYYPTFVLRALRTVIFRFPTTVYNYDVFCRGKAASEGRRGVRDVRCVEDQTVEVSMVVTALQGSGTHLVLPTKWYICESPTKIKYMHT